MNDRTADHRQELKSYLIGFGLALLLTLVPFGVVGFAGWSARAALSLVTVCAFLQMIVHFRFFLHIDLSRQKREDLQLVLFTILLLVIMVCGTLWIAANLQARMM